MLRRDDGDRTEFLTFSLWESLDAIRAFAGDDIETAVYYPEDDRFLIERDSTVKHYEVVDSAGMGLAQPPRRRCADPHRMIPGSARRWSYAAPGVGCPRGHPDGEQVQQMASTGKMGGSSCREPA